MGGGAATGETCEDGCCAAGGEGVAGNHCEAPPAERMAVPTRWGDHVDACESSPRGGVEAVERGEEEDGRWEAGEDKEDTGD